MIMSCAFCANVIVLNSRRKVALPDFEPTLWISPFPTAKGLCFREGKANEFQKQSYGASFTLSLEYGKGETGPFTGRLSKEAYPSPFSWDDGNFAVNGARIPHYSQWGKPVTTASDYAESVPDDYMPPMRTYEDASPEKIRRGPAAQGGTGSSSRTTTLNFEDDE